MGWQKLTQTVTFNPWDAVDTAATWSHPDCDCSISRAGFRGEADSAKLCLFTGRTPLQSVAQGLLIWKAAPCQSAGCVCPMENSPARWQESNLDAAWILAYMSPYAAYPSWLPFPQKFLQLSDTLQITLWSVEVFDIGNSSCAAGFLLITWHSFSSLTEWA